MAPRSSGIQMRGYRVLYCTGLKSLDDDSSFLVLSHMPKISLPTGMNSRMGDHYFQLLVSCHLQVSISCKLQLSISRHLQLLFSIAIFRCHLHFIC